MRASASAALIIAAGFVTIAGCSSYRTRMDTMMAPFVGKPVTAAIDSWGPPTTVYDEDATKVYVWHSSRTMGGGSYTTHGTAASSSGGVVRTTGTHVNPVHTANTFRMFWVGADGVILRYRFGTE